MSHSVNLGFGLMPHFSSNKYRLESLISLYLSLILYFNLFLRLFYILSVDNPGFNWGFETVYIYIIFRTSKLNSKINDRVIPYYNLPPCYQGFKLK